jgi:hypothetical protein
MKKVEKVEQSHFLGAMILFCTVVEIALLGGAHGADFMQVDNGRVLQETLARLSRLGEGEGLLLQPYKKDRSVYVIRRKDMYQVLERGFAQKEFAVATGKIKKILKTLCKKEFPRSNKVWLNFCTAEEVDSFAEKWS